MNENATNRATSSHRQIFKSTALIGGTQVLVLLIGMVRTKVLSELLGTAGMGLATMYMRTTGFVATVAGFGIGTAGVRQIAEAAGTGDQGRIARVIQTLRRASLLSGILGMLIVLVFCRQFSRVTFGTTDHVWAFALLSVTLFCGGVSAGQNALLQGLRRLKDLAAQNVLGTIFGTIASISLVWWLRQNGVAWFIVAGSAFAILSSWWYARRVPVQPVRVSLRETVAEAQSLLGMGTAFLVAAVLGTGLAWWTVVLIRQELGMGAVGMYNSSFTLAGQYVGIVINAMGADFYPRLTAMAKDNTAVNRLVNEQTEIGLLIALPGVLATLALAPWVLWAFYARDFLPATPIIQWQVLGVALRVVSWPMGYIQVAKGRAWLFVMTEVVSAAVNIGTLVLGMRWFGLAGTGIAFLALYVFYTLLVLAVSRRLSGFRWSGRVWRTVVAACGLCGITMICVRLLPPMAGLTIGLAITALTGIGCVLALQRLLAVDIWQLAKTRFGKRTDGSGG